MTNYLQDAGLPTQDVVVTVTNLGFPGNPTPPDNNPQDATQLDKLQVTVTMPFQDVRLDRAEPGYHPKHPAHWTGRVVLDQGRCV